MIILLWIHSWLLNLLLVKDNNTSKTIETLEVGNVNLNLYQYLTHSMFDLIFYLHLTHKFYKTNCTKWLII
jgi:hypothetical protein